MPAVAVRACTVVINFSNDTECRAIALVSADGQQRIIETRRVWTDAEVGLALQEAAAMYGVPVEVERVVAPQPVQAMGQVRPVRDTTKEPDIADE